MEYPEHHRGCGTIRDVVRWIGFRPGWWTLRRPVSGSHSSPSKRIARKRMQCAGARVVPSSSCGDPCGRAGFLRRERRRCARTPVPVHAHPSRSRATPGDSPTADPPDVAEGTIELIGGPGEEAGEEPARIQSETPVRLILLEVRAKEHDGTAQQQKVRRHRRVVGHQDVAHAEIGVEIGVRRKDDEGTAT